MAFKLLLCRYLLPRRWRPAPGATTAVAEGNKHSPLSPSQQRQQEMERSRNSKKDKTLLSARVRLLKLTGNSINSPFHGGYYALLLLLAYTALLVGGAIGLPWLLLSCWAAWGIRMLSFSCGGLSSLFDIMWLPAAVRAAQQRARQRCVKNELRGRLRKELRGLDIAAFLGEKKNNSSSSNCSESMAESFVSGAALSSNAASAADSSATFGGTCDEVCVSQERGSVDSGKTASEKSTASRQRQGLGGRDAVEEEEETAAAARQKDSAASSITTEGRSSLTVRRRTSSRLRKQQQQQQVPQEAAGSSSLGSSNKSGCSYTGPSKAATASAEQQQQQHGCATSEREWQEMSSLPSSTNVKEELQRANFFRQQRAAAAAAAAAAENARRILGLTSLEDSQRRAGKAFLTEKDIDYLLREAHVELDLPAAVFSGAAAAGRHRRSFEEEAVDRLPCRAGEMAAAAASSLSRAADLPVASRSTVCAAGVASTADPTVAPAAAAIPVSPAAPAEKEKTEEGSSSGKQQRNSSGKRLAAEACFSSANLAPSALPTANGNDRVLLRGSRNDGLRPVGDGTSSTETSGRQSRIEGGDVIGTLREEGSTGDEDRREGNRCWTSLIPWNLLFRGFLAHCECTYLVDLIFCHAELSPLSSSIHRDVLLLLHCFIRGMTVFLVFASPYCYMPYSHKMLTRQLLGALCMCMCGSFGAVACMLLVPLFVKDLLQPLLRLLLFPEAVVESDLLLLLTGARLVLPSLPVNFAGSTWNTRSVFYSSSQLVTLVVVFLGTYAAVVRLHDAEPRMAAAARRAYATDVLALLALEKKVQQQQQQTVAIHGKSRDAAAITCAAQGGGNLLASTMKECRAEEDHSRGEIAAEAPLTEKNRDKRVKPRTGARGRSPTDAGEGNKVLVNGRKILDDGSAAGGEDHKSLSSSERGECEVSSKKRQQENVVLPSTGLNREFLAAVGRRLDEDPMRQQQKQQQSEDREEHGEEEAASEEDDRRLSLLLAEKVVEERQVLEASNFEVLRGQVMRWFFHTGGTVAASCLLLCWTAVALLAVSNVAMRVNTTSDIFQEQENVQLMSAAAAAASLFNKQTSGGFEDWAEDLRLLQEEMRDLLNYYARIQRQQGWMAVAAELWEQLAEEFNAAQQERASRKKQEMNAYAVLGVKPTATSADIKKAYKLLAKQLHPDLLAAAASQKSTTPEELDAATERMRKINAAYEELMRKHGGRGGKSN